MEEGGRAVPDANAAVNAHVENNHGQRCKLCHNFYKIASSKGTLSSRTLTGLILQDKGALVLLNSNLVDRGCV